MAPPARRDTALARALQGFSRNVRNDDYDQTPPSGPTGLSAVYYYQEGSSTSGSSRVGTEYQEHSSPSVPQRAQGPLLSSLVYSSSPSTESTPATPAQEPQGVEAGSQGDKQEEASSASDTGSDAYSEAYSESYFDGFEYGEAEDDSPPPPIPPRAQGPRLSRQYYEALEMNLASRPQSVATSFDSFSGSVFQQSPDPSLATPSQTYAACSAAVSQALDENNDSLHTTTPISDATSSCPPSTQSTQSSELLGPFQYENMMSPRFRKFDSPASLQSQTSSQAEAFYASTPSAYPISPRFEGHASFAQHRGYESRRAPAALNSPVVAQVQADLESAASTPPGSAHTNASSTEFWVAPPVNASNGTGPNYSQNYGGRSEFQNLQRLRSPLVPQPLRPHRPVFVQLSHSDDSFVDTIGFGEFDIHADYSDFTDDEEIVRSETPRQTLRTRESINSFDSSESDTTVDSSDSDATVTDLPVRSFFSTFQQGTSSPSSIASEESTPTQSPAPIFNTAQFTTSSMNHPQPASRSRQQGISSNQNVYIIEQRSDLQGFQPSVRFSIPDVRVQPPSASSNESTPTASRASTPTPAQRMTATEFAQAYYNNKNQQLASKTLIDRANPQASSSIAAAQRSFSNTETNRARVQNVQMTPSQFAEAFFTKRVSSAPQAAQNQQRITGPSSVQESPFPKSDVALPMAITTWQRQLPGFRESMPSYSPDMTTSMSEEYDTDGEDVEFDRLPLRKRTSSGTEREETLPIARQPLLLQIDSPPQSTAPISRNNGITSSSKLPSTQALSGDPKGKGKQVVRAPLGEHTSTQAQVSQNHPALQGAYPAPQGQQPRNASDPTKKRVSWHDQLEMPVVKKQEPHNNGAPTGLQPSPSVKGFLEVPKTRGSRLIDETVLRRIAERAARRARKRADAEAMAQAQAQAENEAARLRDLYGNPEPKNPRPQEVTVAIATFEEPSLDITHRQRQSSQAVARVRDSQERSRDSFEHVSCYFSDLIQINDYPQSDATHSSFQVGNTQDSGPIHSTSQAHSQEGPPFGQANLQVSRGRDSHNFSSAQILSPRKQASRAGDIFRDHEAMSRYGRQLGVEDSEIALLSHTSAQIARARSLREAKQAAHIASQLARAQSVREKELSGTDATSSRFSKARNLLSRKKSNKPRPKSPELVRDQTPQEIKAQNYARAVSEQISRSRRQSGNLRASVRHSSVGVFAPVSSQDMFMSGALQDDDTIYTSKRSTEQEDDNSSADRSSISMGREYLGRTKTRGNSMVERRLSSLSNDWFPHKAGEIEVVAREAAMKEAALRDATAREAAEKTALIPRSNELRNKSNSKSKRAVDDEEVLDLWDFLNLCEPSDNTEVKKDSMSEDNASRASQGSRLSQNTVSSIISSAHESDKGKNGKFSIKNKPIDRLKGGDDLNPKGKKEKTSYERYSPGLLNREIRASISQQQTQQHLARDQEKKLAAIQNKHKRFSSLSSIIHRVVDKTDKVVFPPTPQPRLETEARQQQQTLYQAETSDTNSIGNLKSINAVLSRHQPEVNNNTYSPQTATAYLPPPQSTSTLLDRTPYPNAQADTISRASSKLKSSTRDSTATMSQEGKHSNYHSNDSKQSFLSKAFGRDKADKPIDKKENNKGKERERADSHSQAQSSGESSAAFNLTPLSSLIHQSYKDIETLRQVHGQVVEDSEGALQRINFDKIEDSLRAFQELYEAFLRYGSADDGGPTEEVHLVAMVCKREDVQKNAATLKPDVSVPVVETPPPHQSSHHNRR